MTRPRLWRAAQAVLLISIVYWASAALMRQWSEVRAVAAGTPVQWSWVVLASVIVLGTYAALVQSWRLLLSGWGGRLPFGVAARIWTTANLGRYVPGKLWSVGALGVLANREGVSGVAAAGAAILGTMLNIGAGFGILALSGTRTLGAFDPWLKATALSASVAFVVAIVALPRILPALMSRITAWRGAPTVTQHLPAQTLWLSSGINLLSWTSYGLAFWAFAQGVTPQISIGPVLCIGVWTASYLVGYLFLFAPGGIVVREVAMASAIVGLGLAARADATYLALTSRLWLTVWELLPGLVSLVMTRVADRKRDEPTP